MAFKQGGWFMYLILTFAMLGLAIIIERMIVIMFKNRVDSVGFVNQIVDKIQSDDIEDAIRLCNHSNAALPQIVRSGLEQTEQGLSEVQNSIEFVMNIKCFNQGQVEESKTAIRTFFLALHTISICIFNPFIFNRIRKAFFLID